MKRNLLTLAAIIGVGFAVAQSKAEGPGGPGGMHRRAFALDHLTQTLSLTPEQQTKVQPILDQAKPQIRAIHQEAMQKTQAIMESTMAQIRPMLTPEQQKKADEMKKAHEDMRNAMKELHDVHNK